MTLLEKLRGAPVEDTPERDPDEKIRVVCDGTRDLKTIRYRDWPEFRSRSYRMVPPGMVPRDGYGEEITAPDPNAPEDRDIFGPMKTMQTGSQAGNWSARELLARSVLDNAADALAARIGRPRVPRESMTQGTLKPSLVYAADIAQAGITAEAVCRLAERLDAMELELTALRGAKNVEG